MWELQCAIEDNVFCPPGANPSGTYLFIVIRCHAMPTLFCSVASYLTKDSCMSRLAVKAGIRAGDPYANPQYIHLCVSMSYTTPVS